MHTAELVVSLRNFIRSVLDLDPVARNAAIPRQGPARPGAAGGGKRGDGNADNARGGGNKGAGGEMAAGAGMGMGLGGVMVADEDSDEKR